MKLNALLILTVLPFFAACRGDGSNPPGESVIAAINHISPSLQKNEDLRYRLLCAKTRDAALMEIAVTDIPKGGGGEVVELRFEPKQPIQSGDVCRVEVRGIDSTKYASQYDFQMEKDLFYSSTKGEVTKGEGKKYNLTIKIYKIFLDLKEEVRAVASEVTLPEGSSGKYALELVCGAKAYPASFAVTAESGLVFKGNFNVPYKDLAAQNLKCESVRALADDKEHYLEGKLEPAVEITKLDKNVVKTTLVAAVRPGTTLETTVSKAECPQGEVFDPKAEKCGEKVASP